MNTRIEYKAISHLQLGVFKHTYISIFTFQYVYWRAEGDIGPDLLTSDCHLIALGHLQTHTQQMYHTKIIKFSDNLLKKKKKQHSKTGLKDEATSLKKIIEPDCNLLMCVCIKETHCNLDYQKPSYWIFVMPL